MRRISKPTRAFLRSPTALRTACCWAACRSPWEREREGGVREREEGEGGGRERGRERSSERG